VYTSSEGTPVRSIVGWGDHSKTEVSDSRVTGALHNEFSLLDIQIVAKVLCCPVNHVAGVRSEEAICNVARLITGVMEGGRDSETCSRQSTWGLILMEPDASLLAAVIGGADGEAWNG
jgi:hypothetical protein